MKYRMYVDEVGNADLGASRDPNHRYLSLSGVILELEHVATQAAPRLEELKRRYFASHPDEPVILHRKEMMNQRWPFHDLRDPELRRRFDEELLQLLEALDFRVITVVIDKLEHMQRYTTWRFDPYHYCLTVLLERYVLFLRSRGAHGDVMAESRGGREDRRLKDSFARLFDRGSDYLAASVFSDYLTSRQLKVKQKANNIAGLQIADLVAHPGYKAVLARAQHQPLPTGFGGKIAELLERSKYHRKDDGSIWGWGMKLLP